MGILIIILAKQEVNMLVYKTEVFRDDEVIAEFYEDELGDAVNAAEGVVRLTT